MLGRLALYAAAVLALGIVVVGACAGPEAAPSPTASRAPSPSTSPTRSASPSQSVTALASPSASASVSPACGRTTGGTPGAQAQLVAIRIAHQAGFDRLVFEFGRSDAPGPFAIPAYAIEPAASLSGTSGQPVPISGSAIFGIRFQNASTRNVDGTATYTGSTDLKPLTPLIKQVRLVEDFERVLVFGAGLEHLQCPSVLTLSSPFRVVLDFPTPP